MLHPYHSPREEAINIMNSVMNNKYHKRIIPPNKHAALVAKSLNQKSTLCTMEQKHDYDIVVPILNKLSRKSKQYYTPLQQYQRLHYCTHHMSDSMIQNMITNDTFRDIPKNLLKEIKSFNCTCYICLLTKSNRLPRGSLEDKTELAPFERIHLDFHFFNVVSIRGFTSALAAVCATTSYPFNFPTKSKSPPIQIVLYLIRTIRSLGH